MSGKIEKAKWYVSDVIDDGHFGIVTEKNEIVIGSASPLSKEQAEKIVWVHNRDVDSLTHFNRIVEDNKTIENTHDKPVQKYEFCDTCTRNGIIPSKYTEKPVECPYCKGVGRYYDNKQECPKCNGTGHSVEAGRGRCDGASPLKENTASPTPDSSLEQVLCDYTLKDPQMLNIVNLAKAVREHIKSKLEGLSMAEAAGYQITLDDIIKELGIN